MGLRGTHAPRQASAVASSCAHPRSRRQALQLYLRLAPHIRGGPPVPLPHLPYERELLARSSQAHVFKNFGARGDLVHTDRKGVMRNCFVKSMEREMFGFPTKGLWGEKKKPH